MRKNIANWARLVQIVAGALLAVIRLIEAFVDLLNKVANCNAARDRKLQIQISIEGQVDLRAHRT